MAFMADRRLIPRVQQYLDANKTRGMIDISKMTASLQKQYAEYSRKKRQAFTVAVEKAYNIISGTKKRNDEISDSASCLEEDYLEKNKKRQRLNSPIGRQSEVLDLEKEESDEDDSDSFSSGNDEYVEQKDNNMMNTFLSGMYTSFLNKSQKQGEPNLCAAQDTLDKYSSVPFSTLTGSHSHPSTSFFIDRTRSKIADASLVSSTGNTVIDKKDLTQGIVAVNRQSVVDLDGAKAKAPRNVRCLADDVIVLDENALPVINDLTACDSLTSDVKENDEKDMDDETIPKKVTGNETRQRTSRRRKHPVRREDKLEGEEQLSKKSSVLVQKSTVTFSDVGGMTEKLIEVCDLVMHLKNPQVFRSLGVSPPRGFLLHGPPGCGKTLLAHAIAGQFDLPFLKLSATEIVSGVSGESEEKIRDIFQQATLNSPCILFFDEIDAITSKRETTSKGMEQRIVSQLLSCMDGNISQFRLASILQLLSKEDNDNILRLPGTDLNNGNSNSGEANHVLVIGATNRLDSLDPALRRAGRFDNEISLGIPGEEARISILKVLCRSLTLEPGFNFNDLARSTPGFVGADLSALTTKAALLAVKRVFSNLQKCSLKNNEDAEAVINCDDTEERLISDPVVVPVLIPESSTNLGKSQSINESHSNLCGSTKSLDTAIRWANEKWNLTEDELRSLFVTKDDFEVAAKTIQPSAKREGFATIPDITWADIGALTEIKAELQISILAPVKHPELCAELGLSKTSGVLLVGPPGCGKTLLAKAVANESGINFIAVKGPELLNMYVGESERAVRQVFQRARNSAPCVIFFDELDALCPRRSDHGDSGASMRVVNQLLTEMDGVEERKQVFLMGATNRPDVIDPAIMRPGRLDKMLYVGLPSGKERLDILLTITKNGTRPRMSPDVDLATVAMDPRCNALTGADLSALVREASVLTLRERLVAAAEQTSQNISTSELSVQIPANHPQVFTTTNVSTEGFVSWRHFDAAFNRLKPSVRPEDQAMYEKIRQTICSS